MTRKFLVFDIWSSFGHFKKPYTTTSPLTYSIPTRTAITGILAAIIGLDKSEYIEHFSLEKANVAVKIINPVKKIRISENFINTKKSMTKIHERTQIKVEFLKDAAYRVYVSHIDAGLYSKLKEMLSSHSTIYTISMGISEALANFKYVGEFEGAEITDNHSMVDIDSIIPVALLKKGDIEFEADKELLTETIREFFTENIPLEMNTDRSVSKYGEVFFERNGCRVKVRIERYISLLGLNENIIIL